MLAHPYFTWIFLDLNKYMVSTCKRSRGIEQLTVSRIACSTTLRNFIIALLPRSEFIPGVGGIISLTVDERDNCH